MEAFGSKSGLPKRLLGVSGLRICRFSDRIIQKPPGQVVSSLAARLLDPHGCRVFEAAFRGGEET